MSRRKERRRIAEDFTEMTVVTRISRMEKTRKFNQGMQWGLHEALAKLGVELRILTRLEARALEWAREHCPAHDKHSYEATQTACKRCPSRCEVFAEELVEELVD